MVTHVTHFKSCDPNEDYYVGRYMLRVPDHMQGSSGFWGNPVLVSKGKDTLQERKRVLVRYWDWLQSDDPRACEQRKRIRAGELKDQTLVCWCVPKLCHGQILAMLSDGRIQEVKDLMEQYREEVR